MLRRHNVHIFSTCLSAKFVHDLHIYTDLLTLPESETMVVLIYGMNSVSGVDATRKRR